MARRPRVVITGVGVVSPIGIGKGAFAESLYSGRSGVRRLDWAASAGLPVSLGAEVSDFDPKEYVRPRKSLKVMSRDIQLGFTSADLAYADAGLAAGAVDPERIGVVYGADMIYCELDELAAAYRACLPQGEFEFSRWGEHAMAELYPLWLLKYLPNMSACHVSIALDARGPSNSITLGEVSSLVAIQEAAEIIRRGAADVMIAGGASCRLHPNVMVFRKRSLMSQWPGDPSQACRPFDRDRDGMVAGEGAAAVVLENLDTALARGAPILAEVVAMAGAFDSPAREGVSGAATARVIESVLREGGVSPAEIGHVNASGLATREHDAAEARAIRQTLANAPVTAPKSYFGNLGASTGAVELAASLVAFADGRLAPTLNYQTPDPACPVNVIAGAPIPLAARPAVILNQAPAGQTIAMLIAPFA